MIRIRHVEKMYRDVRALAGVDLDVAAGECVGITGVNGSGRSTLLRILATLVKPSAGTVEIDGIDVVRQVYQIRPRLVYVGDEPVGAGRLKVGEYLRLVQTVRRARSERHAREGVDKILARAGLSAAANVQSLSSGLRQRLAVAAALMIRPDVMLLDEPVRALDPEARGRFIDWLREARDDGVTIVAAMNQQTELKMLCDRAVQLAAGRIVGHTQLSKRELAAARTSAPAAQEA